MRRPLAEIQIRVTPKSSRNKVETGDPIKVYVTAPPADGEANKAVVETLSKALHVAKSRITILRGEHGRDKTVSIQGLSDAEVAMKLDSII